ncbi:MAG: hypothetical protein A2Y90_02250 [Chloroflexi bacterium RBG_13_52_12]|nr:MAG: hypothetical protein A2Y90_02250 [Chloroflexi bacterium RBG_13_52_12]
MNRPPMLMHVKIKNKDNDFGIWIPIILLLLIALAVVIVLSPLILLALIIMLMVGWERWARLTLLSIWAAFVSVWAMRGLEVNVQNSHDHIIVSVI